MTKGRHLVQDRPFDLIAWLFYCTINPFTPPPPDHTITLYHATPSTFCHENAGLVMVPAQSGTVRSGAG